MGDALLSVLWLLSSVEPHVLVGGAREEGEEALLSGRWP